MTKQKMTAAVAGIVIGLGVAAAIKYWGVIDNTFRKETPNTTDLRESAAKKIKEVETQMPIVSGHVQALQAREVAAKYAEYSANQLISDSKWPCTFAGVRIETRGDAYRTLLAIEDKHKKIKAELARFTTAQAALSRVQEELEDKLRTLDLVDAHAAAIDATEFAKEIDKIKIPALPAEPSASIQLPNVDLTAVR